MIFAYLSAMLDMMTDAGFNIAQCSNAIFEESLQHIKEVLDKLDKGHLQSRELSWIPLEQQTMMKGMSETPVPNIREISELIFPLMHDPLSFALVEKIASLANLSSRFHYNFRYLIK